MSHRVAKPRPRRRRRRTPGVPGMALAAVAALLVSCSTASPGPSTSTVAPGVDAAGLQASFEHTATELGVPGAFMLVRTPEGEVVGSYGTAESGESVAPQADQHLRVGSNTKTWTGTVILQLAQEGALTLDDPVSMYMPEVPNGANITIKQLLSMRSGLYNYTLDRGVNEAMDADPQRTWDPEDLLAVSWRHPPSFAPGEGWEYSNTNTVLLGLVAEQLDGKPLEQVFEDRLFDPLGLEDTLLPPRSSSALPDPLAHGYMYGTNVLTMGSPPALPEEMQQQARSGQIQPGDRTFDNPSWAWAAGGGISTANDLADWVEALTGGGLLDEQYQTLRLDSPRPTVEDQPSGAQYGLAIAKFGELYGHTGELPGYNSFMGHDPHSGLTVVVWANLAPTPDGRDPATTIARTLIESFYPADD
jgi:D-alanyl-D-alanine carboxypeptidase